MKLTIYHPLSQACNLISTVHSLVPRPMTSVSGIHCFNAPRYEAVHCIGSINHNGVNPLYVKCANMLENDYCL